LFCALGYNSVVCTIPFRVTLSAASHVLCNYVILIFNTLLVCSESVWKCNVSSTYSNRHAICHWMSSYWCL